VTQGVSSSFDLIGESAMLTEFVVSLVSGCGLALLILAFTGKDVLKRQHLSVKSRYNLAVMAIAALWIPVSLNELLTTSAVRNP
jgi:hypothetical protein